MCTKLFFFHKNPISEVDNTKAQQRTEKEKCKGNGIFSSIDYAAKQKIKHSLKILCLIRINLLM